MAVQRTASGSKPHYEEDWEKFEVYTTAGILEQPKLAIIGNQKNYLSRSDDYGMNPVKITYNSVDSTELVSMERSVFHRKEAKLNFPKLGAYLCYPPLTIFRFFTLGGKGNSIIRIGKKSPPARVIYEELQEIRSEHGVFQPDHAVQLADLPPETKVIDGNFTVLPNGLVLTRGKLEGPYFVGTLEKRNYVVAKPNEHLFSKIFSA
jgi:hypothetical protein